MANNYAYVLDGKAYINATDKCRNACDFCIRNTGDGVAGTPLWLDKEPTADEIMNAFDALKGVTSDEVVFCGYGEPTEALETIKDCAARFKARGYTTRLNTNGLGSAAAGRNIAPELKAFDTVSVSLNQCDAEKYEKITHSAYGKEAFGYVVDFADACKKEGIKTVFTVVDTISPDDIERCRKIADAHGIALRVREYVSDNYEGGK